MKLSPFVCGGKESNRRGGGVSCTRLSALARVPRRPRSFALDRNEVRNPSSRSFHSYVADEKDEVDEEPGAPCRPKLKRRNPHRPRRDSGSTVARNLSKYRTAGPSPANSSGCPRHLPASGVAGRARGGQRECRPLASGSPITKIPVPGTDSRVRRSRPPCRAHAEAADGTPYFPPPRWWCAAMCSPCAR
jgi:hypothetical protein